MTTTHRVCNRADLYDKLEEGNIDDLIYYEPDNQEGLAHYKIILKNGEKDLEQIADIYDIYNAISNAPIDNNEFVDNNNNNNVMNDNEFVDNNIEIVDYELINNNAEPKGKKKSKKSAKKNKISKGKGKAKGKGEKKSKKNKSNKKK